MSSFYVVLMTLLISTQLSWAKEIKPYRVYLKPGTILTRLSDQENVEIPKGIYANILEISSERTDLYLVYDKNNKPIYETTAEGIVEIEQDVQILPNINAEIIYPAPSAMRSNNTHALFDTQFNIHVDSLQASVLDPIFDKEMGSATGARYEMRTLYNSLLPVNFGVSINYQTANWTDEFEDINLSILSFGPHLQRYFYNEDNMAASIVLGAEYAPLYRTSSGSQVEKYQSAIFDIGAEALWNTEFGKWSLGAHWRRHDLKLKTTTRKNLDLFPEDLVISSLGVMVGYKHEWDL